MIAERKQRLLIVCAFLAFTLVITLILRVQPGSDCPIAVSVVGSTNDLSGKAWHIVQVTNSSSDAWWIRYTPMVTSTNVQRAWISVPSTGPNPFYATLQPRTVQTFAFLQPEEKRRAWKAGVLCINLNGWRLHVVGALRRLTGGGPQNWLREFDYIVYGPEVPFPTSASVNSDTAQSR